MKNYLLFFLCSLMAFNCFGQSDSPHLLFKGVPIDGTRNSFVSKMKQKGFEVWGEKDGISVLRGDFAGYTGCIVGVVASKHKDLVSKIVVIFPPCDTWECLSGNYFSLKVALNKKYGKPAGEEEFFEGSSVPRDDLSRFQYVFFDRCKYATFYETDHGYIKLRITHDDKNGKVSLVYTDKINGDVISTDALDDL